MIFEGSYDTAGRGLDIIIPFYRNAHLVTPLCDSLLRVAQELSSLSATIVAINDSPKDESLRRALTAAQHSFANRVPFEVLDNETNRGFVQSVNRAACAAIQRRRDVVLLNSDTVVFPGALREMAWVAYLDPMIGFVSPRSNNATICSLPQQTQFQSAASAEAYQHFLDISRYLPRLSLVPTGVGFCLYIRREMLDEFGLFDEVYGTGYNEENDLIMRANRCGFRAALANHAFVYHIGGTSFGSGETPKAQLDARNAALLRERYPEYETAVRKYVAGPRCQAEGLLTGLIRNNDDRISVIFDLSSMGPYHNGTFELAKQVLSRASRCWAQSEVFFMASDEARRFHQLDAFEGVQAVPVSTPRTFGVALRMGQPFSYDHVSRMSTLAAVNVYAMLDPIAFDCQHLDVLEPGLEQIWGHVFAHADGVLYISDAVQELFRSRFARRPGLVERVTYPSLDFRDYREGRSPLADSDDHILVIGNAYHHKRMPETVALLSESFPSERIVALGLPESLRKNVRAYESGSLTDGVIDRLVSSARVVVFPSVYEGFGFPIVRGLAHGKLVVARDTPVARVIREKTGELDNLLLYSTSNQLVDLLRNGVARWNDGDRDHVGDSSNDWVRTTDLIGFAIDDAVQTFSFPNLEARVAQVALLAPERRKAADEGLEALRQRLQSPRYVIADTVASVLHAIPGVWPVITRTTDAVLNWRRRRDRH